MNQQPATADLAQVWLPLIEDLATRIQKTAWEVMSEALAAGDLESVSRATSMGAGDATFGIDEATERTVTEWLEEAACQYSLSLLTEDRGWRHVGPASDGGWSPRADFDHGGPRIAVDPVDGTRNLMLDLRPAWAVIGLAGPGSDTPRQSETLLGCLAELPISRAAQWRRVSACRG